MNNIERETRALELKNEMLKLAEESEAIEKEYITRKKELAAEAYISAQLSIVLKDSEKAIESFKLAILADPENEKYKSEYEAYLLEFSDK